MKVICIANQKGGIGKTTTATALASILNRMGHKTLLIDADPQCNSTDTYRAEYENVATLGDILIPPNDDPLPIEETIHHTEIGDIIPSDPALIEIDNKLPSDGNEYFLLNDALLDLEGYEYTVIDTAPTDNKLLKNCLVAADIVIIPVTADRYSLQGLARLNKTIEKQKIRNNPKLEKAGLLLVKYKPRQVLAKEFKEELEKISNKLQTKVFNTFIRESIQAQRAQAERMNLIECAPKSTTAQDYVAFVEELFKGGSLC